MAVANQQHDAVQIDAPKAPRQAKRSTAIVDVLILLAAAVVGALVMKFLVAQVFAIPSSSMQPTLASGEKLVAEKLTYLTREPQHDDVVVFDGSGLFDPPVPGATTYVKRVIGVGGDRVQCCDSSGKLMRNGVSLDESRYLQPGVAASTAPFDVVVPADRLWLMGDNRGESADSRDYIGRPGGGFIPVDRVVGKASFVFWPLSSARWIQ